MHIIRATFNSISYMEAEVSGERVGVHNTLMPHINFSNDFGCGAGEK